MLKLLQCWREESMDKLNLSKTYFEKSYKDET